MTLEVDTPTLRSVSSDLDGAASTMGDTATALTSVDSPSDPEVSAGLEALTVAWGAAIDVLAEDVSFLSDQVAAAAEVYDTTDQGIADGMRRPR
jgi:Excreted virulence factor EspC, type VII ESX diderm